MNINQLPGEILFKIFDFAVCANEKDGVKYTYGLSKLPPQIDNSVSTKIQKYVRGPIPPYQQKWDATSSIRLVCKLWHDWAMSYAMKELYIRNWRGSEMWCDLTIVRSKYPFYELNKPRGESLRVTMGKTLT
jgi:hypothetical protein